MTEPPPARTSAAGWFSLALAGAAALALLVLSLVAQHRGLKRLVPPDAPLGGRESYRTYVAPVVELVTGFGFFAGAAGAGLAIVDLVRARKRPSPTNKLVPVIALLLGLAALPAAIVVFFVVTLIAGPWPFG
jgi:hypothetical protein